MAIPVEIVDTPATTYVPKSSRYATSQVLLYGENKVATFKTYKRGTMVNSDQDRFTVIPPGEEYRPDLTSYRAYNSPDFWWQIMQINGIFDVYDYKAGKNIRIPSSFNRILDNYYF